MALLNRPSASVCSCWQSSVSLRTASAITSTRPEYSPLNAFGADALKGTVKVPPGAAKCRHGRYVTATLPPNCRRLPLCLAAVLVTLPPCHTTAAKLPPSVAHAHSAFWKDDSSAPHRVQTFLT
ncbi:hypothetical protein K438DRAFT_1784820 [Mycena galopus ATCC 62051]|nr:hypothetical protein K438DRAFT_1784820 [Mycena galopus ATCC 62051]